jgi:hypothetical protein
MSTGQNSLGCKMSASRLQHINRAPDNRHDRISCFHFCSRGLSNLAPVDEQNSVGAPESGVAERQLRRSPFLGNGGNERLPTK